MKNRLAVAMVCLALATIVVFITLVRVGKDPGTLSVKDGVRQLETPDNERSFQSDDRVSVGGVMRPRSDVDLRKSIASEATFPQKPQGSVAPVDPDSNDQTKLVSLALKDRQNPERFSSFVVSNSFDINSFKAEPEKYATRFASVVEPGRVFSPLQPAEEVPVLSPRSRTFYRVTQGETVRLELKALPFAPATFTSHGLGTFENRLTSITVVASPEGIASTVFEVGKGTANEVRVLAASPVTSGQVLFTIAVTLKR